MQRPQAVGALDLWLAHTAEPGGCILSLSPSWQDMEREKGSRWRDGTFLSWKSEWLSNITVVVPLLAKLHTLSFTHTHTNTHKKRQAKLFAHHSVLSQTMT